MMGKRFRAPDAFGIDVEPHRDTIVVVARGELDMTGANGLGEQLTELIESAFNRIVLDLRELSFMDSTGLRTVIAAHEESRRAAIDFAVVRGPRQVQRVFELTGTDTLLAFIEPDEIDWPRRR